MILNEVDPVAVGSVQKMRGLGDCTHPLPERLCR